MARRQLNISLHQSEYRRLIAIAGGMKPTTMAHRLLSQALCLGADPDSGLPDGKLTVGTLIPLPEVTVEEQEEFAAMCRLVLPLKLGGAPTGPLVRWWKESRRYSVSDEQCGSLGRTRTFLDARNLARSHSDICPSAKFTIVDSSSEAGKPNKWLFDGGTGCWKVLGCEPRGA